MSIITTLIILTITITVLAIAVVLTALAYLVLVLAVLVRDWWVFGLLGRGVRWYWEDYLNFGGRKR